MGTLRIFSYLPNPRLYKATIAARISGAAIEIVGAKPLELPNWLWDKDARPLSDKDKGKLQQFARAAKTGFSGTLYKTDDFLRANPFGDVPAGFAVAGGAGKNKGEMVGIFESNSIMRAAARLGPDGGSLLGKDPIEASRIDSFLDRTLLFARDIQNYILADERHVPEPHKAMEASFLSYCGGLEEALRWSDFIVGDKVTLADIVFLCEMCLLTNEKRMGAALSGAGLSPILPRILSYERLAAHMRRLKEDPRFAEDLSGYFKDLPA